MRLKSASFTIFYDAEVKAALRVGNGADEIDFLEKEFDLGA